MFRRLTASIVLATILTACGMPTALQVTALSPADGATDVSIETTVSATFNLAIDETSVAGAFTLSDGDDAVAGVVTYDAATRTATFTPDANLDYATTYTGTVAGTVATVGGATLGGEATWSFTTEDEPVVVPAIGGIDVTPATATVVIGDDVQLTATPTDVVGSPDLTVTWSSDDTDVATVDATGLVTAVTAGTATITATSNFDATVTGTATITVAEPTPSIGGIDIDPAEAALAIGDDVQLTATPTGVVGSPDLTVTWSSDDTDVATVDATGLVTAVTAGTATITATSNFDATVTGTATITVAEPMAGVLENYVLTLDAGEAIDPALEPSFTGGLAPFAFALLPIDLLAPDPITGLPPGVSLDPDTGAIAGTPTQAGFWRAAIEVTDAVGQTLEIWAEIDVLLVLEYASASYGYASDATGVIVPAADVSVIGAVGPLLFSMTLLDSGPDAGAPTDWSIDPLTGAISRITAATPLTTTWTYEVTVFDDGTAEVATFEITFTEIPD